MTDFGLGDWPPPDRGGPPRAMRAHAAYLAAARKAGVPCGWLFSLADVAERDAWACCACGTAVPQRWTADELEHAPALAFAVAWADGGGYAEGNARLAHLGCAVFPDAGLRRRVGAILVRDLAVKGHAAAGDEECANGHKLSGANLLRARDGRRRCRQCRNDRERPAGG